MNKKPIEFRKQKVYQIRLKEKEFEEWKKFSENLGIPISKLIRDSVKQNILKEKIL